MLHDFGCMDSKYGTVGMISPDSAVKKRAKAIGSLSLFTFSTPFLAYHSTTSNFAPPETAK